MEIKFDDVSYESIKKMNIQLDSNKITSIIGESFETNEEILKLMSGQIVQREGKIKLEKQNLTLENSKKYRRNTSYFGSDYEDMLINTTIYGDIKNIAGRVSKTKIYELLERFDLEKTILKRNYTCLSKSEKAKICLISLILKNSKIIALVNPTNYLDNKSKNTLIRILKKLKHENRLVVILSFDSNFLLEISDNIIVIENGQVINQANKYEILSNKEFLKVATISMPSILKFKEIVSKNKNIQLPYRDNINDVMKDVYRYVK